MVKKFCEYFRLLSEAYSLTKLLLQSILISILIFAIDAINLPSQYELFSTLIFIPFFDCLFVAFITLVIYCNCKNSNQYPYITAFDETCVVVLLSSILLSISMFFYDSNYQCYKVICLSILVLASIRWLYHRINIMNSKNMVIMNSEKENADFTLNDLLELNTTKRKDVKDIIMLSDHPADYDLLHRNAIVEKIGGYIEKAKYNQTIAIGLKGKWGSGKTTILNLVEKKAKERGSEVLFIKEFDPWVYSSQDAMIQGMLTCILNKLGIDDAERLIKETSSSIIKALYSDDKANSISAFFSNGGSNNLESIRKRLECCLLSQQKNIVIIIDNIERADKENILLLFKLIAAILNLPHLIYILSYDENELKKIFKRDLHTNYNFLKKIIQVEITVPDIEERSKDALVRSCINKALIFYGEDKNNIANYEITIKTIIDKIVDIRELIRFVNSVLSDNFAFVKGVLNLHDLFAIKTIKYFNNDLYDSIYGNREFYISAHREYSLGFHLEALFIHETFDNNAKEYFERLFNDPRNKPFKNLLSELFPYVKYYLDNAEHKYPWSFKDCNIGTAADIDNNCRISSGKYFSLYFSESDNVFTEMHQVIIRFLDFVNDCNSQVKIANKFKELLAHYSDEDNIELMEKLYLLAIQSDFHNRDILVKVIFDGYYSISNGRGFLQISPRNRSAQIICQLLMQIDNKAFEEFLTFIKDKYTHINCLRQIKYWTGLAAPVNAIDYEKRAKRIRDVYYSIRQDVFTNKINIFKPEYYRQENLFGLYDNVENENEVEKVDGDFVDYLKQIINNQNIKYLLKEIVVLDSKFEYHINITRSLAKNIQNEVFTKDLRDSITDIEIKKELDWFQRTFDGK